METRCPLNGTLDCTGCKLIRKGQRFSDSGKFIEEVSQCVFHQIADCMENLISRQLGQQKEMNKVANQLLNLNNVARGRIGQAPADPVISDGRS